MSKFLLTLLSLPFFGFSAAVTVFNDSPFVLNATILDATGQIKGKITLAPQHQMKWQDSQQNVSTFSETPFTVIFTCSDGTEYGVSNDIPQSSFVSATASNGRHFCKPRKQNPNTRHGSSTGVQDVEQQIESKENVNPGQFQETEMY